MARPAASCCIRKLLHLPLAATPGDGVRLALADLDLATVCVSPCRIWSQRRYASPSGGSGAVDGMRLRVNLDERTARVYCGESQAAAGVTKGLCSYGPKS